MRHVDILEERDSLKGSFFGSLVLHAGMAALVAGVSMANLGERTPWGEPNALGGGAVGVTAVKSIPMPLRSGPVNRLANDTQSQVPAAVKPEPVKAAPKPEPASISIKSKRAPEKKRAPQRAAAKPAQRETASNQVTSSTGAAASSPLYAMTPGTGGVGVGTGAPFGFQFGAYATLVRDRVAQRWRTDQVDPRLRTLPPAIVTFEIVRSGQVQNIRVVQSSGNRALDYSAERAVTEAAPFMPLPAQYRGSSAVIEFWFQLQR
jgi:periplasmic protein TonB